MTVEATYPDGTYRYVGGTFAMLRLVNVIHATEKDCPLKELDLLSGTIDSTEFEVAIKALGTFQLEDESTENARAGLVQALEHAKKNGYDWVVFT